MTVIRRKRTDNFTVLPNEVLNDTRLSFEALGVLTNLLSKPDTWEVSIPALQRRGGIGRDKVYRILNDLIENGYITRDRLQGTGGRVVGFQYTVYDVAVRTILPVTENQEVVPFPDQPDAESPDTENAATRKKELISTNTPQPPKGGLRFETIWQEWPSEHRGNRTNSEGAWSKLDDDAQAAALRAAPVAVSALKRRKARIPALVKFLRERWFEEFDAPPDLDFEGHWVIKPGGANHAEWSAWLGWIRDRYGAERVDHAVQRGFFLSFERWPPGHPRARQAEVVAQRQPHEAPPDRLLARQDL